jgi:hypothetical protein
MSCAKCKEYFRHALDLSERLKALAQKGQMECENDRCLNVYGIIFDSVLEIQMEVHKRMKEIEAGASSDQREGIGTNSALSSR